MHDTGTWVICGLAAWAIVAAWPSKPKWHPFGGMFRHDKRTGQLTVAVTLPGRGKRKSARKRKR
jgi:hypothetical protein